MRKRPIRYEQAVYGNFPFWDRGYALLARSENCHPDWVAALKRACQRFGERPMNCPDRPGFFAIPLPEGPCMIVGVFPNGRDDQGRPGALVFHARFIEASAYRRGGYDPFAFLAGLRGNWSVDDIDSTLPSGALAPADDGEAGSDASHVAVATEIARAITGRIRVVIPSPGPIDSLARAVWRELPRRTRSRSSMATFAYDNGNGFDLVALPGPRAAALARSLDNSCRIIDPEDPTASSLDRPIPIPAPDGLHPLAPGVPGGGPAGSGRLLRRLFRSIIPLAVGAVFLGCSSGREVSPEAIAEARASWQKARIKDYELELSIGSPAGHYRSKVRDGEVLKVESILSDGRVVEVHPGDSRFYTVEGLFKNMTEELAISKSVQPFGQPEGTKVVMKFGPDPQLGYPHWYRRDVFGSNRSVSIDVVRLDVAK